MAGLNKLMSALEKMNGQSALDKRGELRTQFYLHLSRRAGERVADYASRFRVAVSDLKAGEGVLEYERPFAACEATGHRPPKRPARALLLSGAPPEAVQAARELKGNVRQEREKLQRAGELAPCQIQRQLESRHIWTWRRGSNCQTYPVAHAADAVSKFQLAAVLPDRSSQSVINFMSRMWLPPRGAPRQIIADLRVVSSSARPFRTTAQVTPSFCGMLRS